MAWQSHLPAYFVLAVLTMLMFDFWTWSKVEPLLFSWMPFGFWWPALVTLLAVPAYAYIFSVIWPETPQDLSSSESKKAGV
jgi:hypothetical protein